MDDLSLLSPTPHSLAELSRNRRGGAPDREGRKRGRAGPRSLERQIEEQVLARAWQPWSLHQVIMTAQAERRWDKLSQNVPGPELLLLSLPAAYWRHWQVIRGPPGDQGSTTQ